MYSGNFLAVTHIVNKITPGTIDFSLVEIINWTTIDKGNSLWSH